MYKCHACGRQFLGGQRLNPQVLFREYVDGKQTYEQLSEKYGCSSRTIRRTLDKAVPKRRTEFTHLAVVVMDTTYFGRDFGVMVFKNAIDGVVLLIKYVKYETVADYLSGIAYIETCGVKVLAIVCDGRKGIIQEFADIPVQMCQFHQIKTVTKYLTKKPKSDAAIELKAVAAALVHCTENEFSTLLDKWLMKWKHVLNERSLNVETGRTTYTHRRMRSAFISMRNNMKHLFVFERYTDCNIPNTTNSLDGQFSDLKNKLRNHNGLSLERKKKVIEDYFEVKTYCS